MFSWRILRSCGYSHSTCPKGFSAFIVIVSLYDCFSFPVNLPHPPCSCPTRKNPRANLLRQLEKRIRNSLWKFFPALSFALTVCLHAFSWEKPFPKKKKTNFFLQLLFDMNGSMSAGEAEWEVEERRTWGRRMQMQTKRKFEGKAAKNCAYLQRLPFFFFV